MKKAIDWMIGTVAVIVILSVMGAMDSEDQIKSAQALQEAKQHARAEKEAEKRAYAALNAQAVYLTSYDQIK